MIDFQTYDIAINRGKQLLYISNHETALNRDFYILDLKTRQIEKFESTKLSAGIALPWKDSWFFAFDDADDDEVHIIGGQTVKGHFAYNVKTRERPRLVHFFEHCSMDDEDGWPHDLCVMCGCYVESRQEMVMLCYDTGDGGGYHGSFVMVYSLETHTTRRIPNMVYDRNDTTALLFDDRHISLIPQMFVNRKVAKDRLPLYILKIGPSDEDYMLMRSSFQMPSPLVTKLHCNYENY